VYNLYTTRRTQIYLAERQVSQLKAAARATHQPVSRIIRDAIDEKLARAGQPDDFDRALDAIFGLWADRTDLGPTDDYVHRLRRDWRGHRS